MLERALRPHGRPLMHQHWGYVLFLNWRVPAERLRPLIDTRCELDEYDGSAWVSITPFTMWGIRVARFPPLPGVRRTHELNVRTYVHHQGVPGVWFLSLDASNPLAVWGARAVYHLPYYWAEMKMNRNDLRVTYESFRKSGTTAQFIGEWTLGPAVPTPRPGSLRHFLVERYSLFTASGSSLLRADIDHPPWSLREATVDRLASTMLEVNALDTLGHSSSVFAQAEPLSVSVWRPRRVG